MRLFPLLTILAFLNAPAQLFSQSHLQWSTSVSHPNSPQTICKVMAADTRGNSYTISTTTNGQYSTEIFYAFDDHGVKSWEYANDSCATNCNDHYFQIIPIDDEGAIFVGAYDDVTGTQLRVKRIDENGDLVWQQYWITPYLSVRPIKALLDNSGRLVIGMSAMVDSTDLEDFAVAQFDTSGGLLDWHYELPDNGTSINPFSEIISSMKIDASDDIFLCGSGVGSGVIKNYVFKVRSTGTLDYIDECTFSGNNTSVDELQVDGGNEMYVLGVNSGLPILEKRKRSSGNLVWSVGLERDSAEVSNGGFYLYDASIYVLNNYRYFDDVNSSWSNKHYMVTKLDTSSNTIWRQDYFTDVDSAAIQDGTQGAVQISKCNASSYILSTQHISSNRDIMILHKIDEAGVTQWYDTATVQGTAGNFNLDVNCNVYVGRSYSQSTVISKYSDVINSVASNVLNSSFEIFPNPANDQFTIRWEGEANSAELKVYDALGALLMSEQIQKGDNHISTEHLPAGMNVIQLASNGKVIHSKIVVTK